MYSAYQADYWQVGGITQFELTCFSRCSIQRQLALEDGGDCCVQRRLRFLPSFRAAAAPSHTSVFLFNNQVKCAVITEQQSDFKTEDNLTHQTSVRLEEQLGFLLLDIVFFIFKSKYG